MATFESLMFRRAASAALVHPNRRKGHGNHLIILTLGLCLSLLIGCADRSTDLEHLAKAKASRDRGDLRTTVIELKNALLKNPANAEARRLLGETDVILGKGAAAEKELKRAIELGVARDAVLLPLAEALQIQGKNQEILDQIDTGSSLAPSDQATLAAYRGDAWIALGKPDKARAEYERGLGLDSTCPRCKLGLAFIETAENNIETAFKLVDEALATNPKEARLWRFKAELHKQRGELAQAEAAYTQAIDNSRFNDQDRANRALVRIELKKLDKAAEDIRVLKKTAPKFFLTHFADGYLKITQGDVAAAREPLEQALKLNEDYPYTWFYLGLVHLNQNELTQADQFFTRFKNAVPNPIAHKMLALVRIRQRDYDSAKKLLMPVILSDPNDVLALNLLANIEFATGNPTQGLKYLQKLSRLQPEDTSVETRLGTGLIAAGHKEEGLKTLQSLLRKDPKLIQPEVMLAVTFIEDKQFSRARAAIGRLKEKMPGKPLPLNLEAMLLQAEGKQEQAKEVLEKALDLAPGDPTVSENLARIAFRAGHLDRVRALYEGVLKTHPGNPLAQLRLAEMDFREGRFKQGEDRLTDLIQAQPEALLPRLMLARHWLRFGQAARSQTLLEEIRPRYPTHPELLSLLSRAQLRNKQPRRALETAKALERIRPDSAEVQYLLADAYDAMGDMKNFSAAVDRTLRLDPKFLPARIDKIKLLAVGNQTRQAQALLEQLTREYPDKPEVLNVRGWWALRQQRFEEAAGYYRKAMEQRPLNGLVINLSNALWRAGKRQQAMKTLEDWNRKHPQDIAVHYLRASLYQALGKDSEAQRTLQTILEIDPDYVPALNDLAWLLRRKAPKKALPHAERAYELSPKSPDIIDTLAMVVLENGDRRRALRLLEQATKLAPQNPTLQYHLAVAQKENGMEREAISSLTRLLGSKRGFSERGEAERLLAELTGK